MEQIKEDIILIGKFSEETRNKYIRSCLGGSLVNLRSPNNGYENSLTLQDLKLLSESDITNINITSSDEQILTFKQGFNYSLYNPSYLIIGGIK